jgi:hypothetical protein
MAFSWCRGSVKKEVSSAPMKGELRLSEVDQTDAVAMARWAHGFCRAQTVEHLAEIYGVEPTMSAVVGRLSQHLPKEVQSVVARACEAELKKTESKT